MKLYNWSNLSILSTGIFVDEVTQKAATGTYVKYYFSIFSFKKKHFRVEIFDGKLHGKFITWHRNGNKECECNYILGKFDGNSIQYYPNGAIKNKRIFTNGLMQRVETHYKISGEQIKKVHKDELLLLHNNYITKIINDKDGIYYLNNFLRSKKTFIYNKLGDINSGGYAYTKPNGYNQQAYYIPITRVFYKRNDYDKQKSTFLNSFNTISVNLFVSSIFGYISYLIISMLSCEIWEIIIVIPFLLGLITFGIIVPIKIIIDGIKEKYIKKTRINIIEK